MRALRGLDGVPEQAGNLSLEQLLAGLYDQLDREQFCRLLLGGKNKAKVGAA